MKFLAYRLGIGLLGLGAYWALGLVSAKEFGKAGVLMTACMFGLIGFFTVARRRTDWLSGLSIAVFLIFYLDAAVKGFLRSYFGLRPNHSMVLQAVFNTNSAETQEFLLHNWRTVGQAVAFFAVIVILVIWGERFLSRRECRVPCPRVSRAVKVSATAMLLLFVGLHFNPTMAKENPLLFWPMRYAAYQAQLAEVSAMHNAIKQGMAHQSEWQVSYKGEAQRTVVWVIGESVNRTNMSLYGYARRTTPMLDALRPELIVFKDVVSPDASTEPALMKMLTPANVERPDEWRRKPDVLALAKAAGYKTFWLSNQTVNDGWIGLVAAGADQRKFINQGYGRSENNFDANLLPHFDAALADQAPKKLIIVHLLGAHPTYSMRYPAQFARFDSVNDGVSKSFDQQGRQFWIKQQRNEYDNAILYNDYVLGGLIGKLAHHATAGQSALIYASDHGQEVGHNRNHAGHSPIDNSGYEVPLIVWDKRVTGADKTGMESRPYQTDSLEHTVLGLLNVDTVYYDAGHDILASGFKPATRSVNGHPYSTDRHPPAAPGGGVTLTDRR